MTTSADLRIIRSEAERMINDPMVRYELDKAIARGGNASLDIAFEGTLRTLLIEADDSGEPLLVRIWVPTIFGSCYVLAWNADVSLEAAIVVDSARFEADHRSVPFPCEMYGQTIARKYEHDLRLPLCEVKTVARYLRRRRPSPDAAANDALRFYQGAFSNGMGVEIRVVNGDVSHRAYVEASLVDAAGAEVAFLSARHSLLGEYEFVVDDERGAILYRVAVDALGMQSVLDAEAKLAS
jgi:hypothetical protein